MTRIYAAVICMGLAACANPGQNRYGEGDVGRLTNTEFGTVVASRPIEITGTPTGYGAAVGGLGAGLVGSQIGSGFGQVAAGLGGGLLGAGVGNVAERELRSRQGAEYTVTLTSGQTVTFAQNLNEGDQIVRPGQRVMVQTTGNYMRVLPADQLPTEISRPKGIAVHD